MIITEITDAMKGKYAGYEIPKKFAFISEPFTLENGLVTQTMKLKRKNITDKYKETIEGLYKD